MKKILLLLLLSVINLTGYAQFLPSVVHDPVNYGQLALILEDGMEQTQKIQQQITFLQDARKAVTVVNSALKSLNTIEKVLDLSKTTISQIENVRSRIQGLNSDPKYITASANYCMRNIRQATTNITFIADVLSDNALRLNDSERLNLIQQKMSEMELISSRVNRTLRQMERINKKANALKSF